MTHHVYISYSSWDKPVADAVCRELEASGISCWIAPRDIRPGEEWVMAISAAIAACQVVVLILSSRSESSRNVHQEIERAKADSKQIIPILVEDFQPGPSLAYHIQHLHCLDASHIPLSDAVRSLSKNISQTLQLSRQASQSGRQPGHDGAGEPQPPSQPSPGLAPSGPQFNVFISYRRGTDAPTARLIRAELQQRRFKVFLDVDDLRPGHFDESILEHIQNTPSFIIILSPGSLDRCSDPEDWVRKEISCALASRRLILPILMPGFQFPAEQQLPLELRPIRVHHGVNYSHDFFDAMMEKIVGYIRNP